MSVNENVESHKWDINNPILSTLLPHFSFLFPFFTLSHILIFILYSLAINKGTIKK